jgi:hypothetical protein
MGNPYQDLSENLKKVISQGTWEGWSPVQRAYVAAHENQPIKSASLAEANLSQYHLAYSDKKWQIGLPRPDLQEQCRCKFDYCFYAQPRNWSMSSSADVWNLMKCANVECQSYFESCL